MTTSYTTINTNLLTEQPSKVKVDGEEPFIQDISQPMIQSLTKTHFPLLLSQIWTNYPEKKVTNQSSTLTSYQEPSPMIPNPTHTQ